MRVPVKSHKCTGGERAPGFNVVCLNLHRTHLFGGHHNGTLLGLLLTSEARLRGREGGGQHAFGPRHDHGWHALCGRDRPSAVQLRCGGLVDDVGGVRAARCLGGAVRQRQAAGGGPGGHRHAAALPCDAHLRRLGRVLQEVKQCARVLKTLGARGVARQSREFGEVRQRRRHKLGKGMHIVGARRVVADCRLAVIESKHLFDVRRLGKTLGLQADVRHHETKHLMIVVQVEVGRAAEIALRLAVGIRGAGLRFVRLRVGCNVHLRHRRRFGRTAEHLKKPALQAHGAPTRAAGVHFPLFDKVRCVAPVCALRPHVPNILQHFLLAPAQQPVSFLSREQPPACVAPHRVSVDHATGNPFVHARLDAETVNLQHHKVRDCTVALSALLCSSLRGPLTALAQAIHSYGCGRAERGGELHVCFGNFDRHPRMCNVACLQ
eukprot:Rhum_TRINITY_DN15264_c3_g1::Rhum_TRINITY_DN15264_c3_g1_i1::g.149118::m.149118